MMFDFSGHYLIKSIRADSRDFFRLFVLLSTRTPKQQHKFPLRTGEKGQFTVNGENVFERATKQPQYAESVKAPYSKATALSLVTAAVETPVFGHDRARQERLVGVMYNANNVLFTKRFYLYDGGTVGRPYDHPTREHAESYYDSKVQGRHGQSMLYGDLESFKGAIAKQENKGSYNEVLARVKWNLDDGDALFIATNNFESRLLAQDRARILKARLKEYANELGLVWDEAYEVPIYFYTPDQPKTHQKQYDKQSQVRDREMAYAIVGYRKRREKKKRSGDFEFLLAVDNPRQHYSDNEWERLIRTLLDKKHYNILWSLLEKMPDLQGNFPYSAFLQETMIASQSIQTAHHYLHAIFATPPPSTKTLELLFAFYKSYSTGEIEPLRALLHANQDSIDQVLFEEFFVSAMRDKKWQLTAMLVDCIDPNLRDKLGRTVLFNAASHGHAAVVKALLAKGADPNIANNNQTTPLMAAAHNGRIDVVNCLIEHENIRLDEKDKNGNTALTGAAWRGHVEIVKVLLAAGAKPSVKSAYHRTDLIMSAPFPGEQKAREAIYELLRNAKKEYTNKAKRDRKSTR